MSKHTTEETLMYLRQCLLPGNVQDGIDLEVPSWLVREAVTALAHAKVNEQGFVDSAVEDMKRIGVLETKLSKMEEAANQAEMLLDAMAIDGIRSSLPVPVQQLYASVHIALQEALAAEKCKHPNAVSAKNEVIQSGLYCPDCDELISEIAAEEKA